MQAVAMDSPPAVDLTAIKGRQQVAWSAGNYAVVGTTLQMVGESLCEALDVRAGQRVLDVAAGNGNATLAAARRGCDVVSTDYVRALLDVGRARASAEDLAVQFEEADAENLRYPEGSFDIVLSTFGVMFTPDQEKAASELVRVCKRGGKIGLANWTPGSMVGEMFKVIGRYAPPPAGVKSPALWGTEQHLRGLFGHRIASIDAARKHFVFRYRTPQHWLDTFRTYYGPVHKTFGALDAGRQAALAADLISLAQRFNAATDGTLAAPSEYLEVVIKTR
ncbi:MAG TPA: class I SAM-dependent methyltransferase [Burkholderiales bacterium]|nr:class I SAM-dependent methyltransferase [Burkholderiales bacterium]